MLLWMQFSAFTDTSLIDLQVIHRNGCSSSLTSAVEKRRCLYKVEFVKTSVSYIISVSVVHE